MNILKTALALCIAIVISLLFSYASAETFTGYLDEVTQTQTRSFTLPSDGELRLSVTIDQTLSLATSYYHGITIFDSDGITTLQGFPGPTGGGDYIGNYGPFPLKAGTYYVRFARWTGNGNYTATTTHTPQPLANDSEPDDNSLHAHSIPANWSVTGHLGYYGGGGGTTPDELDWWLVSIPADGEFRITLTRDSTLSLATSYYNGLTIYDSNGTTWLEGLSLFDENITGTFGPFPLKSGTYYLQVSRAYGYGGYTLTLNHTPQPFTNDQEPNNNISEAKIASVGSNIIGHLGYYGGGGGKTPDDIDCWSFSMPAQGELNIQVTIDATLNLATSYYHGISILSSDGITVIQGYSGPHGQSDTSGTYGPVFLDAGTYYLRLSRPIGYGGYTVLLSTGNPSSTTTVPAAHTTTIVPEPSSTTTIGAGQKTDLFTLSEWDIYGSAAYENEELIFGDYLGYDQQDQDQDGNPENTWLKGSPGADQGGDYDWIVSKKEFNPPLTFIWTGCFPSTASGYDYATIAKKDPAFTGTAGSGQTVIDWNNMLAFHTNWEQANALLSFTRKAAQNTINTVPETVPSEHGICGEFKIVWENEKAEYYFNGTLVDLQDAGYFGPVRIFFRSFEKPFMINEIAVYPLETTTTTTQPPATTSTTSIADTTSTTTITETTTTVPIICPMEYMVDNKQDIDALRMLRDTRFMNCTGLFLTYIYYRNAAEITSILATKSELQNQMKELVNKNILIAQELIRGGEAIVPQVAVDEIIAFLEGLKSAANKKLRSDIELVIKGIKNGELLNGVGVKVE
jgi:hypothetical protein